HLRRMERRHQFGVYFILKSMELGPSFRSAVPRFPVNDPHYRILARQRSRYTHYYFYIRDEVLGPIALCVGSFLPFSVTYYLNRHYSLQQVEYCRNFIFRRNFPIHKLFERSCDLGLFRLTADKLSQMFGFRLHKRLRGKLTTVLERMEHGHHVLRACAKNAVL